MATMEPTTNANKRIPKMTERAKAALEEQHDGPKKCKNGGEGGNVLKKGRTGPKIDRDTSTTGETLTSPAPNQSRQATVEDVPDDDGFISQGSIDNDESCTMQEEKSNSKSHAEDVPGMLEYCAYSRHSHSKLVVQKNERNSPIYAFFEAPRLVNQKGRPAHEFKCARQGCAATVRRYLNKKDAGSTGNLRKHAKACWGGAAVDAADNAASADEVHKAIIPNILKDGSIAVAYKLKKGTTTYSHRQHTREQTK